MLADEATNDVSGEEKSAEKNIETTAIDESKEATEERIETSEEKVEEEDKSERDEQSDQVASVESAEISTAQKGIDFEKSIITCNVY